MNISPGWYFIIFYYGMLYTYMLFHLLHIIRVYTTTILASHLTHLVSNMWLIQFIYIEWNKLKSIPYAWKYFPNDFNHFWTFLSETELNTADEKAKIRKWNSDYLELMECRKNSNYGRRKCFDCLKSRLGRSSNIYRN